MQTKPEMLMEGAAPKHVFKREGKLEINPLLIQAFGITPEEIGEVIKSAEEPEAMRDMFAFLSDYATLSDPMTRLSISGDKLDFLVADMRRRMARVADFYEYHAKTSGDLEEEERLLKFANKAKQLSLPVGDTRTDKIAYIDAVMGFQHTSGLILPLAFRITDYGREDYWPRKLLVFLRSHGMPGMVREGSAPNNSQPEINWNLNIRDGRIVYMPPEEYMERVNIFNRIGMSRVIEDERKAIGKGYRGIGYYPPLSEQSYRSILEGIRAGNEIDIPNLVYRNGMVENQEGFHRALVARDIGIEKIPVQVLGEMPSGFSRALNLRWNENLTEQVKAINALKGNIMEGVYMIREAAPVVAMEKLYRIIYDVPKGVGGTIGAIGDKELVMQCRGLLERGYMIDAVYEIDTSTGQKVKKINWWEIKENLLVKEGTAPLPDKQATPEQANNGFRANPGLINKQAAYAAHAGTSFEPEKRGEQAIRGFAEGVQAVYERLKPHARTDAEKALLVSEMERFQASYAQKYNDLLYAHSRIYSTMIAGPSGFPAERMRKINEAYDNKSRETYEWKDRAEKAMLKTLKGLAIEEAGGEVAVLKSKIAQAEKLQEMMVEANKIVRKKPEPGIGGVSKHQQLINLGFTERQVVEALTPDYMGRLGFPSFALTNNSANIRRMKERLIELEKREVTPTAEIPFTGGHIVDNREEDRVQIFFDKKPEQAMIDKLKGEGWHWSPSTGSWQRKRTDQAMWSAERILGIKITRERFVPVKIDPARALYEAIQREKEETAGVKTANFISIIQKLDNLPLRQQEVNRAKLLLSSLPNLSLDELIALEKTVKQWGVTVPQIKYEIDAIYKEYLELRKPKAPFVSTAPDKLVTITEKEYDKPVIPYTAPQSRAVIELRWVYGTKDMVWHLVGHGDRDYFHGITQERMKLIGQEAAKAEYLSPALARAAAPVQQVSAVPERGKLDNVIALMEQYVRDGKTYEDFVAGLKGYYLLQSGYQINNHLDVERLSADRKEAGYNTLTELWNDTSRKLRMRMYVPPKPTRMLYPAPEAPKPAEEIMIVPNPETMTRDEYIKEKFRRLAQVLRQQGKPHIAARAEMGTDPEYISKFAASHRDQVVLALAQNKAVTPAVLKDYPDIVGRIRKENEEILAKIRAERERIKAIERIEENELNAELNRLPPPLKRHAETEIYGTLHLPETHKDYHNRYYIALGKVRRIAFEFAGGKEPLPPVQPAEPVEPLSPEYERVLKTYLEKRGYELTLRDFIWADKYTIRGTAKYAIRTMEEKRMREEFILKNYDIETGKKYHRGTVISALERGIKVPDEVLKDYPDLMKKEVPEPTPTVPAAVKPVQSIQDIKQQVIQSIQEAKSMVELRQILKGFGFLPLPEPEKRQLMDLYQNRFSELMGELKFGERIIEEEKKKKRRAPQKVTYAPPSRRLEEFGIKESVNVKGSSRGQYNPYIKQGCGYA